MYHYYVSRSVDVHCWWTVGHAFPKRFPIRQIPALHLPIARDPHQVIGLPRVGPAPAHTPGRYHYHPIVPMAIRSSNLSPVQCHLFGYSGTMSVILVLLQISSILIRLGLT